MHLRPTASRGTPHSTRLGCPRPRSRRSSPFALGPGGLATARDQYTPCCIADAPSTIFTHPGRRREQARDRRCTGDGRAVAGPGHRRPDGLRCARRAARRTPDLGGAVATTYEPAAYRGILFDAVDGSTSSPTIDWPWTAFGPSDFTVSGDPNAMQTPTRTLTASDVAALQLERLEGGADSIALHTSRRTRLPAVAAAAPARRTPLTAGASAQPATSA